MNSFHVYSQIEFFTAIYSQRYFEINYKVLFHIEARVQKLNLNVSYLIQLKKVRASVLYFSDM